jgi:hypothetical protein
MESLNFKKEEVRNLVLSNRHNQITTTYYLILKRKIRQGKTSIADLCSDDYIFYINDVRNLKETKKPIERSYIAININTTGKIILIIYA